MKIDVSNCPSPYSLGNKLGRVLWTLAWFFLFRPSPKVFHGWRRFMLRVFGAKIGRSAHVAPSVRIWAPWNLEMDDHSCLGHHVDCYCAAAVKIGPHSTVSQYSYLCGATHDIEDPAMKLITAPIVIGEGAWVAADVFVAAGVNVGDGAVVGARASVFKDVEPWTVVAGNPAKFIRQRKLKTP
jgi:putative colanic acid biosynthesis acetyltransferase WcaF